MLREPPAVVKLELEHIALENAHIDTHVHVYREQNVTVDVMAVTRGVPAEVHERQTQMIHVVAGEGRIETGDRLQDKTRVSPGTVVIIPRGTRHKIVNTGQSLLRFFTVYC
jgi:mannose-6-phosphate isomerase-like protein (cupin superfamily)